jgi:transcriptional regulator with XRE-family HTH domain
MATAAEQTATSPEVLGARVKALREAMDLSLRDLAERSGVSAPMLSQVERGETSPTLQVAHRIASGLELRLSQLLRLDEDGAVTVVRRRDRRKGPTAIEGHSYEILSPPLPGQRAELSRHTLAPGAATGGPDDPPVHEPGSRETALVESGQVVLACDGRRFELQTGDCVTFDADLPHHFENPGTREAVLLAVVSAGLRRS